MLLACWAVLHKSVSAIPAIPPTFIYSISTTFVFFLHCYNFRYINFCWLEIRCVLQVKHIKTFRIRSEGGISRTFLFHDLVFAPTLHSQRLFYCFAEEVRDKEREGQRPCLRLNLMTKRAETGLVRAILFYVLPFLTILKIPFHRFQFQSSRISIPSLFCLRLVPISISFLPLTSSLISPSIQNAVSYHSVQ